MIVVISNTFSLDDKLAWMEERLTTHKFFPSYLSKREWATIMRIKFEEGDVTNFESSFDQCEAFVVRARYQSSQDMNIKAYGVTLARLATEWEAKARRLFLTSELAESADLNPFKHLHMSSWPCLEESTVSGSVAMNYLSLVFAVNTCPSCNMFIWFVAALVLI